MSGDADHLYILAANVFYLGLALVVGFAGYKYLRFSGCFSSHLITFLVFSDESISYFTHITGGIYAISFGLSLGAVAISWFAPVFGKFCVGALAGYLGAYILVFSVGAPREFAFVASLLTMALVGYLCLHRRTPLVLASAFTGSLIIVSSLDYIYREVHQPHAIGGLAAATVMSWKLLLLNGIFFVMTSFVQLKWTAPAEHDVASLVKDTVPSNDVYKRI
ncbi:hypothetical protein ACHHYP_07867 [Achlya hypogyna]|uniref:Uncharacterized protein n=1 Tax=Achlya hypogyna TaxID=1202772 RepID=A0A1V9ZM09_ACHHY|nr:hypothetical protein ACHHYP_07867 [Achlya hypogyna]